MSLFTHVETGSADATTIMKIADRYMNFQNGLKGRKDALPTKMTICMDLETVHYIYGLDLVAMLKGSFTDLMHDVLGIYHKLDRENGTFQGEPWSPRYQSIQMGECWYCMNPVDPEDWIVHDSGLMHKSCSETHEKELLVEADVDHCFGPQE